jgi:ribosomal protein L11 methyltransferase
MSNVKRLYMQLHYLLFKLLDSNSLADVRRELKKKGLKHTFVIEDDSVGEIFIGGHSNKPIETENAILVEQKPAEVDWEQQWSLFAENFTEGKAHIDLGEKTLLLAPGAGFGDLSHPTTYLMLEMLKSKAKGESIVDIGTGSGILALASLALGAKSAIGIDIDSAAIKHAKENAKINGLNATFTKHLPNTLEEDCIFLMNMILPEQESVFPLQYNRFAKLWITSGILAEQREEYLSITEKWNWRLLSEQQKDDWLGFIFAVTD